MEKQTGRLIIEKNTHRNEPPFNTMPDNSLHLQFDDMIVPINVLCSG